MKGAYALSRFLTATATLAQLASAWPDALPEVTAVVIRQNDETATPTSDAEPSEQTEPTTDRTTAEETPTGDSTNTATGTRRPTNNLNTGATGTEEPTGTRSGDDSSETTRSGDEDETSSGGGRTRTFDATQGAGSVLMIEPKTLVSTALYMIEAPAPITWIWNYTNVKEEPTAINVLATATAEGATRTFTLTTNMTYAPTNTFIWDTNKYSKNSSNDPLLTSNYKLVIYDAESSPDATGQPGYLAPYDAFQFGLYAKAPYDDLNDWKCATCSGAMRDIDRRALGFAATMSIITVLSFTWYVVGFAGLL